MDLVRLLNRAGAGAMSDNLLISATERYAFVVSDLRGIMGTAEVTEFTSQQRRQMAWERFALGWDLHLTPNLLESILPAPAWPRQIHRSLV